MLKCEKQQKPYILLLIMGIVFVLTLGQFIVDNLEEYNIAPSSFHFFKNFQILLYKFFPSMMEVLSYSLFWWFNVVFIGLILSLLILFLYKTKRYDLQPFNKFSFVAMVLTGFYFLVSFFFSNIFIDNFNLSFVDYSTYFFISSHLNIFFLELPFFVLASSFLIKQEYKFMQYISITSLFLLSNITFSVLYYQIFYFNFQSELFTILSFINPYMYLLSLLIFTIGLYRDNNKIEDKIEKNMSPETYIYKGEENKSFTRYFSFYGRASRREYWLFILVGSIYFRVAIFFAILTKSSAIYLISFILFFYIHICMSAKRLHDLGISGWYQSISFIPVIGQIILLWKYCQVGQAFDNIYGKNQLQ